MEGKVACHVDRVLMMCKHVTCMATNVVPFLSVYFFSRHLRLRIVFLVVWRARFT